MSQENYMWSDHKDEIERTRLTLLEGAYDPNTIRQLETLGVSEGWACLEVGTGGGSIAQWLAETVGTSGKVVATDVDTRFLRHLAIPNIEAREHNIITDELETGAYDLVHARLVLMHLPEPVKALRRMADALRPGGWLFIEDFDFGSLLSSHLSDPSFDTTMAILRNTLELLRKQGTLDPYFGRRERSLVEQLGFFDIDHQGWTRVFRGGEPLARYNSIVVQYLKQMMLSAGLCTQEQFEDMERQLRDPSVIWIDNTVFGAWGRKPLA
jgi:SAM-dependent methyltransferase